MLPQVALQAVANAAGSPIGIALAILVLIDYASRIICRRVDWWNTRPLRPDANDRPAPEQPVEFVGRRAGDRPDGVAVRVEDKVSL